MIDPGDEPAEIERALAAHGAVCAAILLTHSHFDHFGALAELAESTGAPGLAARGRARRLPRLPSASSPAIPTRAFTGEATLLAGGETVDAAGISFQVRHVPGHSPGHLSYYADGALFSGDVLFSGGVGRVDLPFGDWETLLASIRSLADAYPPETIVLSGHGPATTLGDELARQPVSRRAAHVVKIERPRGTHDILPSEQPLWRRVIGEMERLTALYGYRPIQTPVFEDTELFLRTSGQGSDVVQKEMYTFADRSDRSLTLRPEGTAPIARAYVEHGLHREPQPQKLYTIGPMYRYGAPGRGRYREHWQLSVEAIGTDDPAIDAEIIQLYDTLLRRLGIGNYRLELNSIGCRECRPAYVEQLTAWLEEHADELGEEARQKLRTSPLRVFDVKDERTRALLEDAPKIGDSLCEACTTHFAAVRADLDATGVAYELVPTLVRGLDYYSRTTWEFIGPMDNENSTISGGGRYDYLVEEIGGPADAGRRLRRRDRAAADRDRGRRSRLCGRAGRRRLRRGRARGTACARAAAAEGTARRRHRSRLGLRRPLAEGPADAGGPLGRGDHGHRPRRRRADPPRPAPPTNRSPTRTFSADCRDDDVAHAHGRRADEDARRRDADARRLGGAPPRPRRPRSSSTCATAAGSRSS